MGSTVLDQLGTAGAAFCDPLQEAHEGREAEVEHDHGKPPNEKPDACLGALTATASSEPEGGSSEDGHEACVLKGRVGNLEEVVQHRRVAAHLVRFTVVEVVNNAVVVVDVDVLTVGRVCCNRSHTEAHARRDERDEEHGQYSSLD